MQLKIVTVEIAYRGQKEFALLATLPSVANKAGHRGFRDARLCFTHRLATRCRAVARVRATLPGAVQVGQVLGWYALVWQDCPAPRQRVCKPRNSAPQQEG